MSEKPETISLPVIENGLARVGAGEWLASPAQPVAATGAATICGQKGFVVPDRNSLSVVRTADTAWFGSAERPFLTLLTALPDVDLCATSDKVLLAPLPTRVGAKSFKLVPMSLRFARPVTSFRFGWIVLATRSRVTRTVLADGETLNVRPEALVAWMGNDPTGSCPKLSVLDLLLPRGPKNLTYSFHGPATVWFEGGCNPIRRRRPSNPPTL